MTRLVPIENVNTRRIRDLAYQYGFSFYTAFKKPKAHDSEETVNALMEEYKTKNKELRDKLIILKKYFFPIYGFYKGKEAIAYIKINKPIEEIDEYIETSNSLWLFSYATPFKFFYNKEKEVTELRMKERYDKDFHKLPLPEDKTFSKDLSFIDLVKTFYDHLDYEYEESEKEKDTFKIYLPLYNKENITQIDKGQLLLNEEEILPNNMTYQEVNILV